MLLFPFLLAFNCWLRITMVIQNRVVWLYYRYLSLCSMGLLIHWNSNMVSLFLAVWDGVITDSVPLLVLVSKTMPARMTSTFPVFALCSSVPFCEAPLPGLLDLWEQRSASGAAWGHLHPAPRWHLGCRDCSVNTHEMRARWQSMPTSTSIIHVSYVALRW